MALARKFIGQLPPEIKTLVDVRPDHIQRFLDALIATLGYAGLQLAELCWLRVADVRLTDTGGEIRVSPVEDEQARHLLKTGNRERAVAIHPTLLRPRLRAHVAAGGCEKTFFFPMPPGVRRRKRGKTPGSAERWRTNALSTALRNHKGGSEKWKRPPTPAILPEDMNAASLRRTFGSLLLRSGKTTAQVAAAIGNTEQVVAQHYAKLRGAEVAVDF